MEAIVGILLIVIAAHLHHLDGLQEHARGRLRGADPTGLTADLSPARRRPMFSVGEQTGL